MATKGTGLDFQKLLGVLPPTLAKEYLSSLGKNAQQGKKREAETENEKSITKQENESHDHSAEDLKSSSGEENEDFGSNIRKEWGEATKDFQHRKKKTERYYCKTPTREQ